MGKDCSEIKSNARGYKTYGEETIYEGEEIRDQRNGVVMSGVGCSSRRMDGHSG